MFWVDVSVIHTVIMKLTSEGRPLSIYVIFPLMDVFTLILLIASDAGQRGASSQSRNSFHSYIQNFKVHDISVTIDLFGRAQRTKIVTSLPYSRYLWWTIQLGQAFIFFKRLLIRHQETQNWNSNLTWQRASKFSFWVFNN